MQKDTVQICSLSSCILTSMSVRCAQVRQLGQKHRGDKTKVSLGFRSQHYTCSNHEVKAAQEKERENLKRELIPLEGSLKGP